MPEVTDVVRTTRLEVVDHRGHTRVVIGRLAKADDMVGISLVDAYGAERLCILTWDEVGQVGLVGGGNNLAGVEVGDAGVHFFIADMNGVVVQSWDTRPSRTQSEGSPGARTRCWPWGVIRRLLKW